MLRPRRSPTASLPHPCQTSTSPPSNTNNRGRTISHRRIYTRQLLLEVIKNPFDNDGSDWERVNAALETDIREGQKGQCEKTVFER